MTTNKRKIVKTAAMSLALLCALFSAEAEARPHSHVYKDAAGTGDYLHFQLESTKAGLITSKVDGRVLAFRLGYDLEDDTVRNVRVAFFARSLDTGSDARNTKMWSYCLDAEHHPRIEVEIPGPLTTMPQGRVHARMNVRGEWHPIVISLSSSESGSQTVIRGHAALSFSELGIPDPSIWVATVDDDIDLDFRVAVPFGDETN